MTCLEKEVTAQDRNRRDYTGIVCFQGTRILPPNIPPQLFYKPSLSNLPMARLNYSLAGGGTWGNTKKFHFATLSLGKQDLPHQSLILGQKLLGGGSE